MLPLSTFCWKGSLSPFTYISEGKTLEDGWISQLIQIDWIVEMVKYKRALRIFDNITGR